MLETLLDRIGATLPNWWSPPGRALYSFVGALFVGYVAKLFGAPFPYTLLAAALSWPTLASLLWWQARLPKGPPNAATIAIAISTPDEADKQLLDRDLIEELKSSLQAEPNGKFAIIKVPPHRCVGVSDTEQATRLRAQVRAHFLVWGDIRRRYEKGKPILVVALQGVVAHRPTQQWISDQFSVEMRAVLPGSVRIDCADDLSGFEILTNDCRYAAKYIIAVAAMLSADFEYGVLLLRSLWNALQDPKSLQGQRRKILWDVTKRRLADCLSILSRVEHARWRLSRDADDLIKSERYLEEYRNLNGEDTDYWISKAICDFVLRNDVAAAKACLEKCAAKLPKDPVSRYGIAFLLAIEGDLDAAFRLYREAFKKDEVAQSTSLTGEPTAFEIEEFLAWYLAEHPEHGQLHFCLGLLNMRRKKDRKTALSDFSMFLAKTSPSAFENSRNAAQKYIEELTQAENDAGAVVDR